MSDISDAPIGAPDADLLGHTEYARKLAHFLCHNEPPFTIGLYGEWGAGKTSLIQLLRYFIQRAEPVNGRTVRFIPFTAWPYRTADELWRALILRIACTLYDAPEPLPAPPGGQPAPPSAMANGGHPYLSIRQFLERDAWVMREAGAAPDTFADYRALVAKLDASLGGISKDSQVRVQINQQESMLAVANAVTAALGTFSPLVGGIRTLFGLNDSIKLTNLLQTDKNESTRERIHSILDFQKTLRDLFEHKAKNLSVCVFIDDLDRCMPDVALDLLEAIKALLGDVKCIFIVAADQQLIGQGLKARFRDLLDTADRDRVDAFYERKGREYFEKIIQFGIPVPEPTSEQAHRFLSAQFPQWMSVSDLVETAIGTNPRRLKQYCNVLDYRHHVWQMQQPPSADAIDELPRLREFLVGLYARDSASVDAIAALCDPPDGFARAMESVEGRLLRVPGNETAAPLPSPMANPHAQALHDRVAASIPLLKAFRQGPRLSTAMPRVVGAVARFADVRPDAASDAMLSSRDRTFMRVLQPVCRGLPISGEKILQEDFERLMVFSRQFSELIDAIGTLAEEPSWPKELLDVERHLDDPATAGDISALSPSARRLLAAIHNPSDTDEQPGKTELREMLVTSPRLSAMLREEITAFRDSLTSLPAIDDVLSKTIHHSASKTEAYRALALKAVEAIPDESRLLILHCLRARIASARAYVDLRGFAKLELIRHGWPELSYYLRQERGLMFALEAEVLRGPASPGPAPTPSVALEHYKYEPKLTRLLKLRPYLKDIKEIQATLQDLAPPGEQSGTGGLGLPSVSPPPVQTPITSPAPFGAPSFVPSPRPAPLPPVEAHAGYETVSLSIKAKEGAKDGVTHTVSLQVGKKQTQIDTTLELGALNQLVGRMGAALPQYAMLVAPRDDERASQQRSRRTSLADATRDVGDALFTALFPGDHREQAVNLFRPGRPVRLLLDIDDPALTAWPWEALYVEELVGFPGLMNCSIERLLRPDHPRQNAGFESPLRVLAVMANPRDTAPLNIEGEMEMLRNALERGPSANAIRLQIIDPKKATPQHVLQQVRAFRPHIFHFTGHGLYDGDKGTLVMGADQGVIVPAENVVTMIDGYGVVLAVLNACDTGNSLTNDAVSSLAGRLVKRGLPAVVASMRQVTDETALMFARDFYTALSMGEPVESAVTEARKALSIENWDWSIYGLFTSLVKLDKLRLPVAARRSE